MRFLKHSVDDFNRYENSSNCEIAVLERDEHNFLSLQAPG